MKLFFLLITVVFSVFSQKKDFDTSKFITLVRNSYHEFSIDTTNKINSSVSTSSFNSFYASKTTEKFKFPVSVNWSNIGSIEIDKKDVQIDTKDIEINQNNTLIVVNLFLKNWIENALNEHIPKSAINYNFNKTKKTVIFSYVLRNGKRFDRIVKEFALNGLLLKTIIQTADQIKIEIEPRYQSIQGKWLCVGWIYQKINATNDIVEGMKVEIVQTKIAKNWYPYDVYLTFQNSNIQKSVQNEHLGY